MRTRQQEYALRVFDRVQEVTTKEEAFRRKYGSMAHKLPVLVRTAGLAQALAFVQARQEEAHDQLLADLAWVVMNGEADALVQKSREAEFREYMWLTENVLTALTWFRRYAQSVLKVEPGEEE